MRCFIAVEIPRETREALGETIWRLKGLSRGIRWVPPENIHLTLKFLGEVKEDLLPEIKKHLAEACRLHAPFTLDVRGTGVFPNPRSPQVIWVGSSAAPELEAVYEGIEEVMAGLGFAKERRRFSPHLTLGRVKEKRGLDPVMKELQLLSEKAWGSVEVREVLLMQSVLKPSGAEYSRVSAFPLGSS